MDLSELLSRYERTQSRRALGGVRALSGFDYELRVYLAEFAEALANGLDVQAAGDEFCGALEALSDMTQKSESGQWVLVQVKRTLNPGSLADAAAEFSTIDHFLRAEGFAGEQLPRYRVVGQYSQLPEPTSWDHVSLPGPTREKSPHLANVWEGIRRHGRLDPPRVERDPWWRLIAATFHLMERPFEYARAALDICLRRGILSAQQVRDRIVELFTAYRSASRSTNRALSEGDFQLADPDHLKALVVGYRPSLALLRDRQFMSRRRHVELACEELERWMSVQQQAVYRELPVFWIAGRSGSGKSVLLLQMMEQMVRCGRRVIWLEDEISRVVPLLAALPSQEANSSEGIPDLIFVDDLYAPRGQQDLDLDTLRRLIASAPEFSWPTVVTCGPPEFEHRLEHAGTRDCLQIREWLLPPVREAEAGELRDWFQDRTGEPARTGPAFAQPEGLIVSMAFEIRHGSLDAFARRFGDRLRASGLDEFLTVPLAINRLYVMTPADWLDEPQWERLEELNRDADFSVLETPQGRRYLRLTHPHISDPIYKAIREAATRFSFANDLAKALRRAWQTDLVTLRQLLRVLGAGHERLDDVDMQRLAERVTDEWTADDAASRIQDPGALADVQVSWACWHARSPELRLDQRLGQPLFEQARQSLRHAGFLWPYLWQRLLDAWPENAELAADAQEWISRPGSDADLAWSFIWERLWRLAQEQKAGADREFLASQGFSWLGRQRHRRDWHFVWRQLLHADKPVQAAPRDSVIHRGWWWVTDGAMRTLEGAIAAGQCDEPGWTFAWQDLLAEAALPTALQRADLLELGHAWLTGREDRNDWSYVWRRLVDEATLPASIDRVQLLVRGHAWLTGREDRNDWSYVWRRLVDEATLPASIDRVQLLVRGHAWLTGRGDRNDWTYIWQRLVDEAALPSSIGQAQLLVRGHAWLTGHEDRNDWNYIWRRLVDEAALPASIDRAALLVLGHAWLTGREDRNEWSYLWQRLVDEAALPASIDRVQLLVLGHAWLTGREDRNEWSYLWQRLVNEAALPASIDRVQLLVLGHAWLTGREDRNEWSYLWQRLVDEAALPASIDRVQLLVLGHAWLTGREDRSDWCYVWQCLWAHREAIPECVSQSIATAGKWWLMQPLHQTRGEWDKLFEQMLDANQADEEVLGAGAEWARKHGAEPQTPPIIAKILRAAPDLKDIDDLAAWLHEWVTARPDDRRTKFVMGYLRTELGHETSQLDGLPGWSGLLKWLQPRRSTVDEATFALLRQAQANGERVKGRIVRRLPKGFVAELTQYGVTAFLPGSQVDLRRPDDWDAYVGLECEFLIAKLDEEKKSVCVSRRSVLEQDRLHAPDAALRALQPGQTVEGIVTAIADFGVFVDLGCVTGLINKQDLAWEPIREPHDCCQKGDRLKLKVLRINLDDRKIYLGLKQLTTSPWEVREQPVRVGDRVRGVISNLISYGAFVQLECGLTGLVHKSHLSWTRYFCEPGDFVRVGQEVEAVVLKADRDRQEIELSIRDAQPNPWGDIARRYAPGVVIEATVAGFSGRNAYMELEPGVRGRLHVDNFSWTKRVSRPDEVLVVGQNVRCVVLYVSPVSQSLRLGLKQLTPDPWIGEIPAKWQPGQMVRGRIVGIERDGLLLELEAGLEGFLDRSETLENPGDDFPFIGDVGQDLEVRILSVDPQTRVIKLSLRN